MTYLARFNDIKGREDDIITLKRLPSRKHVRTLYTTLSETSRCRILAIRFITLADFVLTYNCRFVGGEASFYPLVPLSIRVRRFSWCRALSIRYIRGSLCFMANCFIIFDIFPVYGRSSAFCFMAVYCI